MQNEEHGGGAAGGEKPQDCTLFFEAVIAVEVLRDGQSIANALLQDRGAGKFLYRLKVVPEWRRRGLATYMMQQIVETYGCLPLYLRPEPFLDEPMGADQLIAFYRKFGFEAAGDKDYPNMMRREPDGRQQRTEQS